MHRLMPMASWPNRWGKMLKIWSSSRKLCSGRIRMQHTIPWTMNPSKYKDQVTEAPSKSQANNITSRYKLLKQCKTTKTDLQTMDSTSSTQKTCNQTISTITAPRVEKWCLLRLWNKVIAQLCNSKFWVQRILKKIIHFCWTQWELLRSNRTTRLELISTTRMGQEDRNLMDILTLGLRTEPKLTTMKKHLKTETVPQAATSSTHKVNKSSKMPWTISSSRWILTIPR